MTNNPDAIRADIEATRREFGSDVDALADKVSPSKMAQRQTRKLRSVLGSVKDKELASSVKEAAQPVVQNVADVPKDVAENLREPAQEAVDAVKDTATDAVQSIKAEASTAVDDVKDQATEAKHAVQEGNA